jgi:hypothetical protein
MHARQFSLSVAGVCSSGCALISGRNYGDYLSSAALVGDASDFPS